MASAVGAAALHSAMLCVYDLPVPTLIHVTPPCAIMPAMDGVCDGWWIAGRRPLITINMAISSSTQESPPLPADWSQHIDPNSGAVYFFNEESMAVR